MRAHTHMPLEDAGIEQALDLSKSRAYDCALDILEAHKLTDNFQINVEILLKDIGASNELTFEIAPPPGLGLHSDCRHVVFRSNANVSADSFTAIMRSIKERIGVDARRTWWVDLFHNWRPARHGEQLRQHS
jgi:hypothetical protein